MRLRKKMLPRIACCGDTAPNRSKPGWGARATNNRLRMSVISRIPPSIKVNRSFGGNDKLASFSDRGRVSYG